MILFKNSSFLSTLFFFLSLKSNYIENIFVKIKNNNKRIESSKFISQKERSLEPWWHVQLVAVTRRMSSLCLKECSQGESCV